MENLLMQIPGINQVPEGFSAERMSYSAINARQCSGNFGSMIAQPGRKKSLVRVNNPYDKFTWREREMMAHTWHFHLISAECTIADYMFKYVHELEQMMADKGLLKFKAKRCIKELRDSVYGLQKLVQGHGCAQVMVFCKPIFAPMADEYYNDGGDLTNKIIFGFRKRIDGDVTKLFYCTKNMLNRTGCPHADILNHLQMIMFMVNTDLEFTAVVKQRVKQLLEDSSVMEYHMSNHNARIMKSAKELLTIFFDEGKYSFHDEDMNNVRTLAAVIQKKLVEEGSHDVMNEEIWSVRGNYALYVLLRLAMRIQGQGEPIGYKELKHLVVRLGCKKNVQKLLGELGKTAIPEGDDVIDMLENFDIPEDNESMMQTFYILCLKDNVMYKPFGSEEEMLYRNLRQIVYQSKESVLSDEMLKYIFIMKNGVKKRVEEFLVNAGKDVMRKTLRKLKQMKVADFKHPRGRYYFDFWHGLETVRRERNLSDKDMMALLGAGKSDYYRMKSVTSLKYTGGARIRKLVKGISHDLKIDAGYFLYLSIKESDEMNLIAEMPFEDVLARGMIVYLSKDEPGIEMDLVMDSVEE